jgi:hypothetical protein
MAEETPPAKQPQPQDERAGAREPREKRTPGTDMQDDDTGTTDSGQAPGRGTPAQSVMKQEHKTEQEPGSGP